MIRVWLLAFAATGAFAENWPSFRGADARGVGEAKVPVSWNATRGENIAWRAEIPEAEVAEAVGTKVGEAVRAFSGGKGGRRLAPGRPACGPRNALRFPRSYTVICQCYVGNSRNLKLE
jgi:hypothetical protein